MVIGNNNIFGNLVTNQNGDLIHKSNQIIVGDNNQIFDGNIIGGDNNNVNGYKTAIISGDNNIGNEKTIIIGGSNNNIISPNITAINVDSATLSATNSIYLGLKTTIKTDDGTLQTNNLTVDNGL